jgi:hypothetical protein
MEVAFREADARQRPRGGQAIRLADRRKQDGPQQQILRHPYSQETGTNPIGPSYVIAARGPGIQGAIGTISL